MKKFKDIIVIGFALFAMFFGAGNLVFPPYLGLLSGSQWNTGFIGFLLTDVGLAFLAVLAAIKTDGSVNKLTSKAGKYFGIIMSITIMICLGPLLAIPRTGATTYEVGIMPLFKNSNPILFSIVFFFINYLLSIRQGKVIDIIGQLVTPLLLLSLAVLIVKGIATPLSNTIASPKITNVFTEGLSQGYQTMDALGATALSAIVIASIINKGYTSVKSKTLMTVYATLVASVGLILVYGGLTYLGATTSNTYQSDVSQTSLIVGITDSLLGYGGKTVLSIIVALACLTTAVGLTSATANFFDNLTSGKIKYEIMVLIICVFSAIVSNFGVSVIIQFSAPILSVVYPITMVLIIMTLFDGYISNQNVFKGASYFTFIVSLLTVISGYGIKIPYLVKLPLSSIGFNWIVPAIVGGIIGAFVKDKKVKNS